MSGLNLVFICTHGIGDLIMTAPTIRLAAAQGHRISLLVKGSVEAEVARLVLPGINFEMAARHEFSGGGLKKALGIVLWLRKQKAHWIFAQYNVNPGQFSQLAFLGGGRRRVGWKGPGSWLNTLSLVPEGGHKVEETARYLELLEIEHKPEDLRVSPLAGQHPKMENLVLLGPGSGEVEAHKRWPAGQYGQLARELATQHQMQVEVLGGPGEVALCQDIVQIAGHPSVIGRAGQWSIAEVFKRLGEAQVVVANCNGVAHMAVATGTPVVGIYGPTDAAKTGPFCQDFRRISLDLHCAPCYRKGYIQGCGDPRCMTDIQVQDVLPAVLEFASP